MISCYTQPSSLCTTEEPRPYQTHSERRVHLPYPGLVKFVSPVFFRSRDAGRERELRVVILISRLYLDMDPLTVRVEAVVDFVSQSSRVVFS